MKLFIKIFLFVFVTLITNVKVMSATIMFPGIQKVTISFSFQNEIPKTIYKVIENELTNSCQSKGYLVDYSNRGIGVEVDAAKGVTNAGEMIGNFGIVSEQRLLFFRNVSCR